MILAFAVWFMVVPVPEPIVQHDVRQVCPVGPLVRGMPTHCALARLGDTLARLKRRLEALPGGMCIDTRRK